MRQNPNRCKCNIHTQNKYKQANIEISPLCLVCPVCRHKYCSMGINHSLASDKHSNPLHNQLCSRSFIITYAHRQKKKATGPHYNPISNNRCLHQLFRCRTQSHYDPLIPVPGDLMDFLALTNSSINFALYCAMSRQFRTEFQKLLGVKILKNWIPMVENFAGTSYIVTQVIKFYSI